MGVGSPKRVGLGGPIQSYPGDSKPPKSPLEIRGEGAPCKARDQARLGIKRTVAWIGTSLPAGLFAWIGVFVVRESAFVGCSSRQLRDRVRTSSKMWYYPLSRELLRPDETSAHSGRVAEWPGRGWPANEHLETAPHPQATQLPADPSPPHPRFRQSGRALVSVEHLEAKLCGFLGVSDDRSVLLRCPQKPTGVPSNVPRQIIAPSHRRVPSTTSVR
jgi:hypothetical protein